MKVVIALLSQLSQLCFCDETSANSATAVFRSFEDYVTKCRNDPYIVLVDCNVHRPARFLAYSVRLVVAYLVVRGCVLWLSACCSGGTARGVLARRVAVLWRPYALLLCAVVSAAVRLCKCRWCFHALRYFWQLGGEFGSGFSTMVYATVLVSVRRLP